MILVRCPEFMNVFAEKMRQIGGRLKSAGDYARDKTSVAAGDIAKFWQKARRLPGELWESRRSASAVDSAWPDRPVDAPQNIAGDIPAAAPSASPAGWRARAPGIANF